MYTDVKPNSHKYKAEQAAKEKKKVESVVKGNAKLKKKNEFQKVAGSIISEDAKSVKSYILMDVLVPAIKDAIEDIVTNGIRMLLRGDTSARRGSGGVSHISYNKAYDKRDRSSLSRPRGVMDFDDLILDTRAEAEDVLRALDELIDHYNIASVADMYEAAGIRNFEYTAQNYGWTDIRRAEVVRVRNGYWLKMPKVCPID